MNKKYRTQATILLIIGVVLSPSIYLLFFWDYPNDQMGFYRFISYIIFPLPALASVICLTLGFSRLYTAKSKATLSLSQNASNSTVVDTKQKRQVKSNLIALTIGTILLGVVGIVMLAFIIHVLRLDGGLGLFIVTGAIPVCVLLFTAVMIPINIKNITKLKNNR